MYQEKNKGFTLTELIAVVVVLALIALIVVPSVGNILAKNKMKLCEVQMQNIIDAAKNWGAQNITKLPSKWKSINITLKQLQEEGYIDKNIKNPSDGESISDDLKITISRTDNKYNYKLEYNICNRDSSSNSDSDEDESEQEPTPSEPDSDNGENESGGESGSEEGTTPSEPDDNVNIAAPTITSIGYDANGDIMTAKNGYVYEEKVKISYSGEGYGYFTSNKDGTTDKPVYICEYNSVYPRMCTKSTTSIIAGQRYKLDDNNQIVTITYADEYTSSSSIEAINMSDLNNFNSATLTTLKIDRTPPVISNVSYRAFYDMLSINYSVYDSGSDFGSSSCTFLRYSAYNYQSNYADRYGCTIPYNIDSVSINSGSYNITIKDVVGNTSEYYSSSIDIDKDSVYYSNY